MFYAARQRAISKLRHEKKKGYKAGGGNYRDFLQTPEVKAIYHSFSRGGSGYLRAKAESETAAAGAGGSGASTSAGSLPQPVNDPAFDNDDIDDLSDDVDIEDAANDALRGGNNNENNRMDTNENNGPNVSQEQIRTGSGAQSQRTMGGLKFLPRHRSVDTYKSTYRKSRVMFSYGYSNETINQHKATDDLKEATTDFFTTPLALIPVDWLPFYMSEVEFDSLPEGAVATACRCKVTCLGTRVAFDTGSTMSGTATSEYIPIGLKSIGMNITSYGKNVKYTTSSDNPMKPNEFVAMDLTDTIEKYYSHSNSCVMNIPRSLSHFWVHEWNKSANPNDRQYPEYMTHQEGMFRQDENVDSFLINNIIGETLVDYEYRIKAGALKSPKKHWIPWTRQNKDVYLAKSCAKVGKIGFYKKGSTMFRGRLGIQSEAFANKRINNIVGEYSQQLECYGAHHPLKGTIVTTPQPQVHVGIIATPQLNPSNELTTFLNTCCYWSIQCELDVVSSHSSAFSKGSMCAYPQEVIFYPNETKKYTTGETLLGVNDTDMGNVSSFDEEWMDEDPLPNPAGSTTSNRSLAKYLSQISVNK